MGERVEIVSDFYSRYQEEERLIGSRQGQLEYRLTMDYIHRYLKPGMQVLDIGAGTGRYSKALAEEGYEVKAIELVEANYKVLANKAEKLRNMEAIRGDALDLGRFADETFDITLLFGPMYHLYSLEDQHRAIDEAIRVTKRGGVLLVAFLSVHAIMVTNYLYQWESFTHGYQENFDDAGKVRHFPEQLFTGFDIVEFEELFGEKPVEHLTTVAVDNVLEVAERRPDFSLDEENFEMFYNYQKRICEKREMLGTSSHLLYICRRL